MGGSGGGATIEILLRKSSWIELLVPLPALVVSCHSHIHHQPNDSDDNHSCIERQATADARGQGDLEGVPQEPQGEAEEQEGCQEAKDAPNAVEGSNQHPPHAIRTLGSNKLQSYRIGDTK